MWIDILQWVAIGFLLNKVWRLWRSVLVTQRGVIATAEAFKRLELALKRVELALDLDQRAIRRKSDE